MAIATLNLPSAGAVTATATYFLRVVQVASLAISCFGVCYLVWMHNNHYCTFSYCNDSNREAAAVPVGEVVYTVTCVLVGLEWIYASSSTLIGLSRGKRPGSFTQLCSVWASVIPLAIGIAMFTSISTVRQSWPLCYYTGYIGFSRYYPPETNHCILTQTAVTTGLIAIICLLLLGILAIVQVRSDLKEGRIRLPLRAAGSEGAGEHTEPGPVGASSAPAQGLEGGGVAPMTADNPGPA